jgi:hypothetical protein
VEKTIQGGEVATRRAVDPTAGPVVVRIHEETASGMTPGAIARRLNAEGVPTARGGVWQAGSVTDIVDNDVYEGKHGYPAIVDGDLKGRARAQRTRLDPGAAQRRKGGHPGDDSYVLKGIAFCTCGAPLYTTRKWTSGKTRAYLCRERIKATGLCDRPPIPAELAEGHVLRHLDSFVGTTLDAWIGAKLQEHSGDREALERQLETLVANLASLDARREARMAEMAELGMSSIGIELVERIDQERSSLLGRIEDAEARLAEWTAGRTLTPCSTTT